MGIVRSQIVQYYSDSKMVSQSDCAVRFFHTVGGASSAFSKNSTGAQLLRERCALSDQTRVQPLIQLVRVCVCVTLL